jgi:hypothetical protein
MSDAFDNHEKRGQGRDWTRKMFVILGSVVFDAYVMSEDENDDRT